MSSSYLEEKENKNTSIFNSKNGVKDDIIDQSSNQKKVALVKRKKENIFESILKIIKRCFK